MLTRIRIEVEEETAEACVEALWKYEHAMQLAEARRYVACWPVTLMAYEGGPDEEAPPVEDAALAEYGIREHPWSDAIRRRSFFTEQLGREVVEEIIEYDEGAGYRGRRVVKFVRLDMRSRAFVPIRTETDTRLPYVGKYPEPQPDAVDRADDERAEHLTKVVSQIEVRD